MRTRGGQGKKKGEAGGAAAAGSGVGRDGGGASVGTARIDD
jgi:hypothetical protein